MPKIMNIFDRPDYYSDDIQEFFDQDRVMNRIFIVFFSGMSVLHFFSDYTLFGVGRKLFFLGAIRLAYIFFSAATLVGIERVKEYRYYAMGVFLWSLLTLVFIFIVDGTRPKNYMTAVHMNTLLIMAFFVILRLRLELQVIIATLAACSISYQLLFLKDSYPIQTSFNFVISIIVIFSVGIIFSKQIRGHRIQIIKDKVHEKMLNDELRMLADTDALTGLFSRRKIRKMLQNEMERKKRYRTSVSVILFDIDFLKQVNDRYGHDAGDMMITQISSILKNSLRQTDAVGRIGGDEFLIVLPNSNLSDAVSLAERINRSINSSVIESNGNQIPLSGTMGLSEVSNSDISIDEQIKCADIKLYEAKKTGRNKFCY